MPSFKRKLYVILAIIALVLLAAAVGCTGFFQNPTLTALTVTPIDPSIELGQTLQMSATGTYNDGSTSTNIKGLSWSISPNTDATISSSGLVTATAISTSASTITATSGTATGTTTVTVVLANVSSITVTPTTQSVIVGQAAVNYTAVANISGQAPVDITGSATWQVLQGGAAASDIECTFVSPQEECSAVTGATPGTYTIQVTYASTNVVGTATLNVTQ